MALEDHGKGEVAQLSKLHPPRMHCDHADGGNHGGLSHVLSTKSGTGERFKGIRHHHPARHTLFPPVMMRA